MADRPPHQEELGTGVRPAAPSSIYARLLDGDRINHAAWLRTHAEGGFVGTCPQCGNQLRPEQPSHHGQLLIYEAECVSCHHVVCAPGGRTLRRSARHSQMPSGWWEQRKRGTP